jgi:hypothetical protein
LKEAEDALNGRKPGTFLVRSAESHTGYALSICLRGGGIQHFKVIESPDRTFMVSLSFSFACLVLASFDVICHLIERSAVLHYPALLLSFLFLHHLCLKAFPPSCLIASPSQVAGNEGRSFTSIEQMVEHYRDSSITDGADFCEHPCPRGGEYQLLK